MLLLIYLIGSMISLAAWVGHVVYMKSTSPSEYYEEPETVAAVVFFLWPIIVPIGVVVGLGWWVGSSLANRKNRSKT